MGFNIFLDINIIIDFFLLQRPFHSEAKRIMLLIESGDISGYISESVLNTSAYILGKGIPIANLKDYLSEMVSITTVLPCSNTTVQMAYINSFNDLEDAVLYQLALENKLDYFITSNIKDFKRLEKPSLPVIKSTDFVMLFG
jgi:predicted nucleic acid-binding protein